MDLQVNGTALGSSGVLLGLLPGTCETRGAYSDVGYGTQATIRDAAGVILGFGNLYGGVSTMTETGPTGDQIPTQCTFSVTVHDVPDEDIYSVEVGQRGQVQFSRLDLVSHDWTAVLSLGN